MSLAVIARNAAKVVQQRSPIILTGLAVAGVVSTAVLAARAHAKAEVSLGPDVPASLKERLQMTWTLYIPPVATGLATIGCVIGAQSINARRQAALIGAFTLTEGAFQEYKDQVAEALTKTQQEKLETSVAQKKIDGNPPSKEMLVLPKDKVLCLDLYTGRYFHSSMESIRSVQNDINERILNGPEGFVSLNEFYIALGLEESVVGEQVGFSLENLCDINFNTAMAEGGVPCLTISFRSLPDQAYTSLHK